MNRRITIAILAFIMVAHLVSCNREEEKNKTSCPGTEIASWKVGGETQRSHTYVYTHADSVSNLTLTACVDDANDKIVQIGYVPYPPTVGLYPIRWDFTLGAWNGFATGQYITDNDGSYITDTLFFAGSFSITTLDTSAKTIGGGFHFNAREVSGTRTVSITDGVFTNIKYE